LKDIEGNQMFDGPLLYDIIIPRQTEDNLLTQILTKVGKVTSKGALSLLVAQFTLVALVKFLFKTIQKAALNEVYGMFTFLQLIVFIPLIHVNFPANSLIILEGLV